MVPYLNTIRWAGQEADTPAAGRVPDAPAEEPQRRGRRIAQTVLAVLGATVLGGCEPVPYYGQLAAGQLRILGNRQPIIELTADPAVPDGLKSKLELILKVRKFAEAELHLPVEDQYLSYVDLQRPYAIWNVYAAPEFSLQPKLWRYPFIGRAAYRGYFSVNAATAYAGRLASRGYDTHVGGAVAYSTLGWFADPVFSTMLDRSPADIAALIFHELAHRILYVAGDTAFNESFASTVEQEGIRRWLERTDDGRSYRRLLEAQQRQREVISLLQACRKRLEGVYGSNMGRRRMRARKAEAFRAFQLEYERLRKSRPAVSAYDRRVAATPWNNAKLISLAVYRDYVPAFSGLLRAAGNDLSKFYATCRSLASLPKDKRDRRLHALLEPAPAPNRDAGIDAK